MCIKQHISQLFIRHFCISEMWNEIYNVDINNPKHWPEIPNIFHFHIQTASFDFRKSSFWSAKQLLDIWKALLISSDASHKGFTKYIIPIFVSRWIPIIGSSLRILQQALVMLISMFRVFQQDLELTTHHLLLEWFTTGTWHVALQMKNSSQR